MGRATNIIFALIGIVIVLPVLLAAAGWIRLVSSGSCIFTQTRIGLNGTPFRIFKLRTMSIHKGKTPSKSVTIKDDPRLFNGAAFLRSTKIDELPQLFNVLNGSMNLVGPRATTEDDYARMDVIQRERFSVRPGLTGLAQISGNTSLTWPERIEYDLEYISKQGFWYDLRIIFLTIILVLTNRADTHPLGDDEW